jgi:hypothetical protein
MHWTAVLRRLHKWIAVVVGLQLLAWTTSGLVFTLDPIAVVRGETLLAEPATTTAPVGEGLVALPEALTASGLAAIDGARLVHARGRWVWELSPPGGAPPAGPHPVLVDARSGERLADVGPEEARALAVDAFLADAPVAAAERVDEAAGEVRGRAVPLWRVRFDDAERTCLYVDATTGAIAAVRTDTWRRFDWFWMLHIMDYDEREDFHTPLLTTAAAFGMATSLTGLLLAVAVLWPRRRRS